MVRDSEFPPEELFRWPLLLLFQAKQFLLNLRLLFVEGYLEGVLADHAEFDFMALAGLFQGRHVVEIVRTNLQSEDVAFF